jgi:tripartite-type tricarboxylate transporter receptor subunit TctC
MIHSRIGRRAAMLAMLCLAATATVGASAQDYPSRPIRILLGFGPGGIGDLVARLYAQKMSELLKSPVIVDIKPGAAQMVAIRALQNSPPDGYTLYLATGSSLVHNPGLRKDLGYDPLKDFTLISMVDTVPAVIITNPSLPVRSMGELIAYLKANPGKLNYASAGLGSSTHLATEVFLNAIGATMAHIPYKSDADTAREVTAGTVQVGFLNAANAAPAIKAGNVRGLAVTTPSRLSQLPEVPTLAETGIEALADLEPHTLHALVGPAGIPVPIVARLNETINKISAMPDVEDRMRNTLLLEPAASTPASFRAFVEKELAKWTDLGKRVKITIE